MVEKLLPTQQQKLFWGVLQDPLYKGTLLGEGSMICVGICCDLAVTQLTVLRGVVNDEWPPAMKPEDLFIGLPYLEVWLIATDSRRRGRAMAKQLVDTILDLATNHRI